ncbi:hypothetical protein KC957_00745 [Candidatus Saccharibacteria bacterium]|nr:hypothetical protein [Candidatus Saccharibacteria bacterium]
MRKHLYIMILLALLLSVTATLAPGGSMSTAQAGVGDLVPLGDQLGDVGQYYSQVSPSMNSRVYVYNTASASRTAVISIYQDAPVNAAAYHTATCDIAANQVLYLRMNDVVSGTLTIEGGTGAGCTAGTGKVYRSLHHMKIVQSGGGADLAVSVNTWTNPSVSPDLKQVSGAYQAVPSSAVASEYVLPAVLLGRTTGWDTEIVVQNVSGVTTTVTFDVSPDSGGWFNNNVATLNPNERRVFLASQLLYAPAGGGTLEQKDGWAWMKLRAFHATNYTPQNVAVTINMFKQGLTDGKYRAEYGSERLMQFEAPLAGTELLIPGFKVDGTNSYFRVANASTWTTNITAKLYNSSGSQVGSTYTDSVNNQKAKSFAGNVFGAASGTYTLRIQSTYNVTAAAWYSSGGGHTGVTAQRVGDTDGTGTYLPFYWENHYGWQDEAQYSNTSGSGVYTGSLYKRSDGSFLSNWVFWPWGQYAQASTSFSGYNNELYAKLLGAYPLAVGRFENYSTTSDRILSYNGIAKKAGTWYVPFAPAPVVTFVDSSHIFKGTSGNPTAWNGTLGDADTDDYVFYNWDKYNTQRANCNVASGISMHKYAHSQVCSQ